MVKNLSAVLAVIVIFQLLFCFPTQSLAQENVLQKKVSIHVNELSLDQALDELSEKCDCYFTYNSKLIDGSKQVSLMVENTALNVVLDALIKLPDIAYQQINKQIVIHPINAISVDSTIKTGELSLSGVIKSASSQKPLPFAAVSLKNKYLGAIANQDGIFEFNISEMEGNDTLIISHLGYFTQEIPVSDFPVNSEILLKEGVVSLQEIVVRTIGVEYLLSRLRRSFDQNYQLNPYNYDAFYREFIKKGSNYVVYGEAIIKGYKPKLKSGTAGRVEVIKGRKYVDLKNADTLLIKLRGGLETCLELDIVRDLPTFLLSESEEYYDFNTSDIVVWQDQLVYVIEFKQKKHIPDLLMQGELYVSTENFALLGAEFKYTPELLAKSQDRFVIKKSRGLFIKPESSNYLVKYHLFNGLYYPQYVSGQFEFKVKKRKRLFAKKYTTNMEMAYTYIDTNNVFKPSKREAVKLNSVLSDHLLPYNYEYWNGANIIQPETNIQDALFKIGVKIEEENWIEIE